MKKETKSVRISSDTYTMLIDLKKHYERDILWIVNRAIENLYKVSIGNLTKKGEK